MRAKKVFLIQLTNKNYNFALLEDFILSELTCENDVLIILVSSFLGCKMN